MILEVKDLEVRYGSIAALKGVSLSVKKGELAALIGSNGAGKTTLLRTISGLLKPARGDILFEGKSIQKLKPHQVTALRIAQSPEGRKVFAQQTVKDNLLLGAFPRFRTDGRKVIDAKIDYVYSIFPKLKERQEQQSGTLSGGEQQMLAIGRALMLEPKLLLLDEPSMGLAPIIIDEVFQVIRQLKATGEMTILLVEQLAYRALQVADDAFVLEQGLIRLSGKGSDLLTNPDVQRAYLGAKKH
jgi:branched-chain amino acid transport system ATP-binding protein